MKNIIRIHFILLTVLLSCSKDEISQTDPAQTYSATIEGNLEKGPFLTGSDIIFYELDNTLSQTGKSYNTNTTDNYGTFSLQVQELTEQYARIVGDGFYWNETTNDNSDNRIRLNAISNVQELLNVNILTHLEYDRVIELVNNNNITFGAAKLQAVNEILDYFGISLTQSYGTSETYNFIDGDEASKILLVLSSVILQNRTESEITTLLANLSNDFKDNGEIDNSEINNLVGQHLHAIDMNIIASNVYLKYQEINPQLTPESFNSTYLELVKLKFLEYFDADNDGVHNGIDLCPDTPEGIAVNANGCHETIYLDTNGITIKAHEWAVIGDTETINEIEYTVVSEGMLRAMVENDEDLSGVVTSKITNFSSLFNLKTSFNQDIGFWDVSNATNMYRMFRAAVSFNQNLYNWDVSSVVNMKEMFSQAHAFNQDIDTWDVSNVTNMNSMFYEALSFNQSLNSWDVSNVTDMSYMFNFASAFNSPIANWDVGSVVDMTFMFRMADNFNQNIGNWNVSNVTSMNQMFGNCEFFNQDLSNWDVSNVQDMMGLFGLCSAFNQDIGNWNVSNVTNMYGLFSWATSFNQDISNWDVSNVQYMTSMFQGASSFNQNIGNWNMSNVINIGHLFHNASSFNQDISNWDVSNVDHNQGWLSVFEGASSFNQDISSWDVSNATDMSRMFYNATSFNQDLSGWCVTNITQEPVDFDTGADNWIFEAFKPNWGTCPN